MNNAPASMLSGRELKNGWTVGEKITRKKTGTGGFFSVGYEVHNKDGRKAFLKAVDFSAALQAPDRLQILHYRIAEYIFERDLLKKCKNKHLSKVVIVIEDGDVIVPGFFEASAVYYLIFELAKGNIRDVISTFDNSNLVWMLRLLHHVASGVAQLHRNDIAHQDLKPSNILFSQSNSFKISDLGRAVDRQSKSPHDDAKIAGDLGYAPLDLCYRDSGVVDFEKRYLTDIYLFGSLIFFLFTYISAMQALRLKLEKQPLSYQGFQEDLPYLQLAFEETIDDLRKSVEPIAKNLTEEIIEITKQLCEPDPKRRGDPKWKSSLVSNYNMQTYISKFDLMAKKARFI